MFFKLFDWFMTKLGRKYALVDGFGNIAFYRYYVFFLEKHLAESWKEKYLPNLFVHHFVGEKSQQWIDGEMAHTHPWNTLSIVLKGGYTEEENYSGNYKTTVALGIITRKWNVSHRFTQMTQNTWSLFFHGVRKGMWALDVRVHNVICPTCQEFNGGVCMNTGKTGLVQFTDKKEIKESSIKSKNWREPTWIKCDTGFEQLIATRKRTIENLGKEVPKTFNERYNLSKKTLLLNGDNETIL